MVAAALLLTVGSLAVLAISEARKARDVSARLRDAQITQQEPNTLTCLVDRGGSVKVSFFGLPHLRRIRTPLRAEDNGLEVASLLDLAGTKAAVVQQRAQAKDYIDIDALITQGGIDLPTHLAALLA